MIKKLMLYLDTSVISYLFAEDTPEKMADTNKLWSDFTNGKYDVFISDTTLEEIDRCHEPKRSKMTDKIDECEIQFLKISNEVKDLSEEYLKNGVLNHNSIDDCRHIAFAVVNNCDIIVSWNFKHLVNYRTINKVKIVNAINQYREISIMSPTMLIGGD
ncbi:MAG: PIN domain-containing protein [Chitinispirillales bacterium]|jgi:predicted nucleic acid-binding protein|nr:PIN domain-containing protein [Chitinispirillales bacterium]